MQLRPRGDGIRDFGFAFSANQRGDCPQTNGTNEGTVPYGLTTLRSDEKSRKPASRQSREQRAEMRFHCVIISPLRTTAISNKMQPSEPFIVTIAETNEGTVPYGLTRNQRGDCPLWPHDATFRREIPQTRITAIGRTTGGNEISLRNNLTLANNRNI